MDLSNKIVTVVYMSTSSVPNETTVRINITQEVAEGVFKQLDTYELKFDRIYQSPSDPALLSSVNEKLTALP
jgi:hypothetical protein